MMDVGALRKKHSKLIEQLELVTRVNPSRLSRDMARLSSLIFRIGVMKSDAEFSKDQAENRIGVIEARIDKKIRAKYNGKRKPSEQQIKTMVQAHPLVMEAKDAFIESKWKHSVCWSAASSLVQKGNQLSNLAYNYRKELEQGITGRVKDERAKKKSSRFSGRGEEE